MSEATVAVECDECYGHGFHVGPICCGNTVGGDCKIDCAIPEQTACEICAGTGKLMFCQHSVLEEEFCAQCPSGGV